MKYLTIFSVYLLLIIINCLFVSETNGLFSNKDNKSKDKGACSLYKGRCGGTISNKCCKKPYICSKQTKICGKDKLCCVSEADIQSHKQESGAWLNQRNGK